MAENQDLLQNRIQNKEELGDLSKSGSVPLVTVPLAEDTAAAFIQSDSQFNKKSASLSNNQSHNQNKSDRMKQTYTKSELNATGATMNQAPVEVDADPQNPNNHLFDKEA